MRETLPLALQLNFGAEGGYANRPTTDRGGPTKFGITARTLAGYRGVPSVTASQVKALTIGEAEEIYRRSYWTQAGGDLLPAGLDYVLFDAGVMSGPARAVKQLQALLGVRQDGWIGEQTLAAVRGWAGGIDALIEAYVAARLAWLQTLGGSTGWRSNGRGWTVRLTGDDPEGELAPQPGVVGNALAIAHGELAMPAAPKLPDGPAKAEPKETSPWANPNVIFSGAAAILGSLGALFSGMGPAQWALAAVILAFGGIAAWWAIRYVKSHPV